MNETCAFPSKNVISAILRNFTSENLKSMRLYLSREIFLWIIWGNHRYWISDPWNYSQTGNTLPSNSASWLSGFCFQSQESRTLILHFFFFQLCKLFGTGWAIVLRAISRLIIFFFSFQYNNNDSFFIQTISIQNFYLYFKNIIMKRKS